MKRRTYLIALLALAAAAPAARAQMPPGGEGTRAVRQANDTVRDLLRSKVEPGTAEEKKLATQVTRSVRSFLDIDTLGKDAMRDHWPRMTGKQRSDFLRLLRGLVEANYVKALRANLDYEVRYLGEQRSGDGHLVVKTEIRVQRHGRPRAISIDYILIRNGSAWRAFDVVTDGVGLVENYRAQFNKIITRDGVAGLLDRMRKKRASM